MTIYINGGVGSGGGNVSVDTTIRGSVSINDGDSPYAILTTADIVEVDTTTGVVSITIPNTMEVDKVITITDVGGNCGTNAITVTPDAGGTIDGITPWLLNRNYNSFTIKHLGSNNWKII